MVGILGSLSKIKYSYETIQPDKTIYFMRNIPLFTKAYFKLLHHLPLPFDLEKLSTPTELLLGIDGVEAGVVVSILGPTDGGFDPVLEFRRETLLVTLEFVLPCLFGESLVVVGIEDLGRVFEVPLFCTRGERPAK